MAFVAHAESETETCNLKGRLVHIAIAAGCVCAATTASRASVTLNFTNVGSASAIAVVQPGGTFNFSVNVVETAAGDRVSGADYQIRASAGNVVQFVSRNSSAGPFSSPNGFSDAYLNSGSYSPHTLSPSTGTDLGTSLDDPAASVGGPGTADLADYAFRVLPGAPTGTYTLSMTDADYIGAPPAFATVPLTPTATFTLVVAAPVPEPAAACVAAVAAAGLSSRRRR